MSTAMALFSVLCMAVLFGSLIALIFRRVRRKATWTAIASFVCLVISIVLFSSEQSESARQMGFKDATEMRLAKEAGVSDAGEWHARHEKAAAELRELLAPPDSEAAFIAIISRSQQQYKEGQNELQRGSVRPSRANALCSTVGTTISRWIGKLESLSTNGDGKGVLSIKIADHLHLKTWNNSLSDISDRTLIESDTPLYRTLLTMKAGDTVRVEGELISGGPDCFREGSMTLGGAVQDPEFIVRFSRIDRVELPQQAKQ
jgi:hypothetical protein